MNQRKLLTYRLLTLDKHIKNVVELNILVITLSKLYGILISQKLHQHDKKT